MTKWRIVVLAAVSISFIAFIAIKEIAGQRPGETQSTSLQTQLDRLYDSTEPFLLIFHAEPAEMCCEGTRIAYEEMRNNAETLLALAGDDTSCLYVDVNSLISDDRKALFSALERHSVDILNSALVIGGGGATLKEFSAPYNPADIVAFVQNLR
jgi:hypothetical protein